MKTIIIGIDGGTWDVILPLIKKGKLSNIAHLMETGVWGNLHSTYPPITIPAWVSCVTGVNPGKLGVFHFMNNVHQNYQGTLFNATEVKVKRIWEILTEMKKKSIIITVPGTYPPLPFDGIMVSSVRPLQSQIVKIYPEDIKEELKRWLNENLLIDLKKIKLTRLTQGNIPKKSFFSNLFQIHLKVVEIQKKIVCNFIQKYKWDFFMVVFPSTDIIQHCCWHYYKSSKPLPFSISTEDPVSKIYMAVDKAVGEIFNCIDPKETSLFVVSDHGFGPLYKMFFVNQWLKDKGWLTLKKRPRWQTKRISLFKIFEKLSLRFLNEVLPSQVLQLKLPLLKKRQFSLDDIDWEKTIAYYAGAGININLEGREPKGIVKRKEFDRIMEIIKKELKEIKDPWTGKNIVKYIFRKEEIFQGPYVEKAPDLLFFFSSSEYLPQEELNHNVFSIVDEKSKITGHHFSCFNGIFILNSPAIKSDAHLDNAHIMDITPNVLYLMGLPVAEEMDGRVWIEVVKPEFQKKYPLRKVKYNLYKEKREIKFGKEEEEEIKRQLKDLGYLG